MKSSIASLLAIFTVATAHAGSLGGPPPFSNGSPLVTGVDGSYQASSRAENVTGIFRFQYSGGSQTATTTKNNWIFFIDGIVKRGSVVVNLNDMTVDGVLDSLTSGTNTNGGISLPIYILSDSCSGNFWGKMSANGDFNGKGNIKSVPASTNSMTVISQETTTWTIGTNTFTDLGVITSTNIAFTNAPGSVPDVEFKFRGVRTSTQVSTTTTN